MTTASDKTTDSILDGTWENQDPKARIRAIEELDSSDSAAQASLVQIATTDETDEVRCCAIMRLSGLDELKKLQNEKSPIKDSALQQSYRIIAGTSASGLSEEQSLSQLTDMSLPALKQISLITKSKTIGSSAVSKIELPEDLADLSLFAASVHVRKSAALKIEDPALLAEIREKVRNKDKTVFKVIDQRLSLNETPAAPTEVPVTKPDQDKQDIEASSTEKAPEPAAEQEHKQEEKETTKPKPAAKPPLVPEKELPVIEQELPKLSYKKTERLYEIRSILNKLLSNAEAMGEELSAKANEFKKTVAEKLEKNIEFQENIKQSTEALLESLKLALEEGNSESAIKSWDKIQGNISNTSNRIRENLQKQANAYKAKLTELRSWKTFASTEKKKEIITQMEHLIESRMHAADRSKHISNMHQEWKSLGRSNQNEQLWKTFKTLSDKAYEPCKEYFKQRKQQMVDNLKERRKICDQLEVEVKSLFPEKAQDEGSAKDVTAPPSADEIKTEPRGSVNITALNKLLSAAEKDWKHFAPIEQSKIKSLQKRFYGSVNQLRKLRKHAQSSSAKLKQDCVAAAQALITLEDNKKAMNEAKRLQQEWKKIGPTSYKEDNKYWAEFRAACDKIFEKRDQVSNELKQNLKQAEQDLAKILESLAAIFEVDDDSFRKSRNEYKDLSQEFSNALDPRLKQQRGRLLDRFNNLKRKIDSRYKTLPDKKQQQLKKAVMDRANFLEKIEIELLNTKDDSQFQEIRKQSRESAWEALESSGNAKLDSALADRFSNLSSTDSINSMRKLASSNESKFRLLCIQSEIRANIDTPSADQSQRMQLQLQQLQSGFGKSKPEPKENAKHAFGIELEAMCYGPIENAPLQELRQRLDNAVKKLL